MFAHYFRELRKKYGFTQTRLAEKSGISARTIIYWEASEREPRLVELETVLDVLNATKAEHRECLQRLQTPRSIRALQEIAQENSPAEIGLLPHQGDLLKTLRVRRGWDASTLANEMGVHLTTIMRWESQTIFPNADDLLRMCKLLHSPAAETEMLLKRQLISPPVFPADFSPDFWQERIRAFEKETNNRDNALIDLHALTLRRELWPLAAKKPEVQKFLAELNAHYAQWLLLHSRKAEASRFALSTLNIMSKQFAPEAFCAKALHCLAVTAIEKPVRTPEQGYRVLKQWASYFTQAELQIPIYAFMAETASQAGRHETAEQWMAKTTAAADRTNTLADAQQVDRMRARIYTRIGRVEEALQLLPPIPKDDLVERLILTCLWTNGLRKAGEKNAAATHLSQLYSDIATHHAVLFRPYADELASEI